MKVEDTKCNKATSRFTVENRTELQQRGLVGWFDYVLWHREISTVGDWLTRSLITFNVKFHVVGC